MNTLALISTAALLSVGTASAAVTFSSPPYGANLDPIDGVDGWTQSESNYEDGLGVSPLFYVQEGGGNNYGYLSGIFATPENSSFSVSRDFALPASTIEGSTLSFKAAIVDANEFPERDLFGMTVTVGAVDLLTLTLTPESQTGSSNWAVDYLFDGGSTTSTLNAVAPGSLLDYEIDFTASGLEVRYGAQGFSGTPAGYDSASEDNITVSFFWTKTSSNEFYGDNGLLIDDIDVVATPIPEPASACLVLLGITGIALRRRR
jgi:hypothetical protein